MSLSHNHRCLALCLVLAGALPASMAAATETPPAEQGLGDIIVTAQYRRENMQKLDTAITVLSAKDLDDRAVYNVNDLENAVPSLEVDSQFGGGQPQFRLRGVGGTDYAANNGNTVGIYYDEILYPYGVMTQNAMYDVARVEVLRGPQGTLYGRNTTGGAVNVITNAPSQKFGYGLDASYGSFNASSLKGYINGGLTSTLSARLAFSADRGGAWQINRVTGEKLGNKNQTSLRLRLRWQPDDATTVDLNSHFTRDKSDGLGLQLLSSFTTAGGVYYPADTSMRATGWGVSAKMAELMGVPANSKPFRNNEGEGVSLRLEHSTGFGKLIAIYGHEEFIRREFNDWDATSSNEAGTYFFNHIKVDSGELRLASRDKGNTRWQVGAYGSREAINGGFLSDFSDYASLKNYWSTTYDQRVTSLGLFGQVEHYITSRLKASVGGRYIYEKRSLNNFISAVIYPTYSVRATASPSMTMNEWSGKAALDWDIAPDIMAYASVSRGVKSGGFTTYNSGLPQQLDPYNPEKLIAYEIGAKSEWFDRRLRLNLAGFYYDYRDQQLQGVLYTDTARVGRIINVPKSHIYGLEGEVVLVPVKALTLSQSVAYKLAKYDDFSSQSSATLDATTGKYVNIQYVNNAGVSLPLPKLDYKGAVTVHVSAGGWTIEPEFNYMHRTSRYSTSAASVIPAYWLANANLALAPKNAPISVTLWAHNVFDAYIEETRNQFISARTRSTHEPRTVGITVSLRQ